MAPNRMSTTININFASGNKNASGVWMTRSGETNGSGSANGGGVIRNDGIGVLHIIVSHYN